jgi:transposase
MRIRDALGALYTDPQFADLFAHAGRPAEAPSSLALVCVFQFIEALGDRQAADAVRTRIDWKYALGLPLNDAGFCHTVLGDFRERLLAGGQEAALLAILLERCRTEGWLDTRRQRTDSTHVLGALRGLRRTELVGETLRATLNALAVQAPQWLQALVPLDWYERYACRVELSRLPKDTAERHAWMQTVGCDGALLLAAVWAPDAPLGLRKLAAVEVMRQIWLQHFVCEDGVLRVRSSEEMPPVSQRIISPYEVEARIGAKRDTLWDGYKVHLTETVTPERPQLISHVETTPAPEPDGAALPRIHQALAEAGHCPREHLVDAGYIEIEALRTSKASYQIDLVGPVLADTSWQARAEDAFDVSCFRINWSQRHALCPQGKVSTGWSERTNHRSGDAEVLIRFAPADCRDCAVRAQCTSAAVKPRTLTVRAQEDYEVLQAARLRQQSESFKTLYAQRAGVEGTIAQGVQRGGLRRSRYRGLAKTHLQHILLAVAVNLVRLMSWLADMPRGLTRRSAFAALAPG